MSELDELDREEFYRLKKVSGKKHRDAAAEEKERQLKKTSKDAEEKEKKIQDTTETQDLFGDKDNEDVIF